MIPGYTHFIVSKAPMIMQITIAGQIESLAEKKKFLISGGEEIVVPQLQLFILIKRWAKLDIYNYKCIYSLVNIHTQYVSKNLRPHVTYKSICLVGPIAVNSDLDLVFNRIICSEFGLFIFFIVL